MAYAQAGGAAAEASVGNQGAFLSKVHRLDIRGRIEHLLHSGAALGAFVADYYHVAAYHLASEDAVTSLFLRVEHLCGAAEMEDGLVHARGLHYAAVLCQVALEHGQAAVLGIGVGHVADAALGAICIEGIETRILGTHLYVETARGGATVYILCLRRNFRKSNAILGNCLRQRHSVYPLEGGVYQAGVVQALHKRHNAACASHVLYVVLGGVGSHLAEAGHLA